MLARWNKHRRKLQEVSQNEATTRIHETVACQCEGLGTMWDSAASAKTAAVKRDNRIEKASAKSDRWIKREN